MLSECPWPPLEAHGSSCGLASTELPTPVLMVGWGTLPWYLNTVNTPLLSALPWPYPFPTTVSPFSSLSNITLLKMYQSKNKEKKKNKPKKIPNKTTTAKWSEQTIESTLANSEEMGFNKGIIRRELRWWWSWGREFCFTLNVWSKNIRLEEGVLLIQDLPPWQTPRDVANSLLVWLLKHEMSNDLH